MRTFQHLRTKKLHALEKVMLKSGQLRTQRPNRMLLISTVNDRSFRIKARV